MRNYQKGTQTVSYDCFAYYKDVKFLINVKLEKKENNAVAAINRLYNDYVIKDAEQEKAYIVLKTKYAISMPNLNDRKIITKDVTAYALEEVDFTSGHRQDHRSWSVEFNPVSGRLQINNKFRENNKMNKENISYQNTKQFITKIFKGNK